MNAYKFLTLSVSLLAFSSLQADEPPFDAPKALQETCPLEEQVDMASPVSSIEEEIDSPVVNSFKMLPTPVAEEDEAMELSSSEQEMMMSQALEAPIASPAPQHSDLGRADPAPSLQNSLLNLMEKRDAVSPLVQPIQTTAASVSPMTPAPRIEPTTSSAQIDMREVFQGAPLIYSLLLVISIGTIALWLYTLLNMRTEKLMPQVVIATVQEKLSAGKTKEALALCQIDPSLLGRMLRSGLLISHTSPREITEIMQSEGKRVSGSFWQKLGLLNDVAVVAPMIGLLGTVVGMFYAFYDINRSVESMNSLFDGLGISVGTTVAGLILAIVALVLHSTSKYRLVKQLTQVESTANNLLSRLYTTAQKEEAP